MSEGKKTTNFQGKAKLNVTDLSELSELSYLSDRLRFFSSLDKTGILRDRRWPLSPSNCSTIDIFWAALRLTSPTDSQTRKQLLASTAILLFFLLSESAVVFVVGAAWLANNGTLPVATPSVIRLIDDRCKLPKPEGVFKLGLGNETNVFTSFARYEGVTIVPVWFDVDSAILNDAQAGKPSQHNTNTYTRFWSSG